jgi:hypothetical protein
MEKLCVFCKHLKYSDGGWGDYAEAASLNCKKGRDLRPSGYQSVYDVEDFREMILTAQNCPDYDEAR